MEEFVKDLFGEFEGSPKKIRLVGVRVSNLRAADAAQKSILRYADRET